jgi:hypothetical protein
LKSFAILRTNTGLTTNVKIMVDSGYGLSLESIDSVSDLSFSRFKKMTFNKENYLDDVLPAFYSEVPVETAFSIKHDFDEDSMTDNFANQYDEIYQYGARNIIDNKNYTEEYEYFAPLYISKGMLPKYFSVFRVDGPGLGKMDKSNFRNEILKNLKCVKIFDMRNSTPLGQWLEKNIDDNDFFPDSPFDMNFSRIEFSQWNGIDYETGGYTSKSLFLDDYLEKEREIFEMERFVLDGYKNNKVIFPNIFNLSFLFDDTPADKNSLKKWSMNRYYGFYIDDMEKMMSISPYLVPKIKDDASIISGNIIYSLSGDPFVNGWSDSIGFWVEYNGSYYKVQRFFEKEKVSGTSNINTAQLSPLNSTSYKVDSDKEVEVSKWKIITDLDLTGKQSNINKNFGYISDDKILMGYDNIPIEITEFGSADIWLIEIDGIYHNLIMNTDGNIEVVSDHSFEFRENSFDYMANNFDPNLSKTVSLILADNTSPISFPIYRAKLSEIKDFDTRIVDTIPSRFEYEMTNDVTKSEEPKMHFRNLNSETTPKEIDYNYYKNERVEIPASSEYTANQETFKIDSGLLSPIWRKNPIYCRWSYQGSLSSNDYPYLLNNSKQFGEFNGTTDTFTKVPLRKSRNLDYFYTINSSWNGYEHQTLHIDSPDGRLDRNFKFDFEKYLGKSSYISGTYSIYTDFDYFSSFFGGRTILSGGDIVKNSKKYSEFTKGSDIIPSESVFRGIKFQIYDTNIKIDSSGKILDMNPSTSDYGGYRLSILMSESNNSMQWQKINKWDFGASYKKGDIVYHDDLLYIAKSDTTNDIPTIKRGRTILDKYSKTTIVQETLYPTPYNQLYYQSPIDGIVISSSYTYDENTSNNGSGDSWEVYRDPNGIFFDPIKGEKMQYSAGNIIYNSGFYYIFKDPIKTIDFWNPITAYKITSQGGVSYRFGYSEGTIVHYQGKFYKSLSDGNIFPPSDDSKWSVTTNQWNNFRWDIVRYWSPIRQYQNEYVILDETLYVTNTQDKIPSGTIPSKSVKWKKVYSMNPDTDIKYQKDFNPYIKQGSQYLKIVSNPRNSTLENGIKIYVNKRFKNILINIYVNDNTIERISNSNRDDLYSTDNSKITASNFIDSINNIQEKNQFSDYLTYIIIGEDGGIAEYKSGSNIENLPMVVLAQRPEAISVVTNSFDTLSSPQTLLNPNKSLKNNQVLNKSMLNYYNSTHFASEMAGLYNDPIEKTYYRFSGRYMPLFYDIELFNSDNSVLQNRISLMVELSDVQRITFRFEKDSSSYEKEFVLSPSRNYNTAFGYYSQIANIVDSEFPEISFKYEISKDRKPKPSGLIMDLDETSYDDTTKRWYDISGNGNFGLSKTPTTCTFSANELYPGPYMNISGGTNSRSFITLDPLKLTSSWTMEMMVNSSDVINKRILIDDENGSMTIGFTASRPFIENEYDSGQSTYRKSVYGTPILGDETWYHLVFRNKMDSKSTMQIFVDGVDRSDYTTAATTMPSGGFTGTQNTIADIVLSIGGPYTKSTYLNSPIPSTAFKGKITNVRVYGRALSDSEIYDNFVSQHDQLIISHDYNISDLNISLYPMYPKLTMDIIDYFDPMITTYDLILGATGGNEPYTYSVDGAPFSSTAFVGDINKGSTKTIVVKDILGLTSSTGYYTVNTTQDIQYKVDGAFIYS